MRKPAVLGTLLLALVAGFLLGGPAVPRAAAATTRTVWVDPVHGRDGRTGATAATALRTLTAAWALIPASRRLDRPVRILVRSGSFAASATPNYWEHRWGTATAPISLVSVDGPGRAQLPSVNMYDVRHLTLDGIAIRSRFDPFHCERCSFLELRRSAFVGIGDPARGAGPQEGVKLNQSDMCASWTPTSLARRTTPSTWWPSSTPTSRATRSPTPSTGAPTRRVARRTSRSRATTSTTCGTGGITLGQGTGVQFMQAPWNTYGAYGAWAVNNVLHDIAGAALGVNGGFAVLLAHNTAYRTGGRDHAIEVVFGERSCDGSGEDDALCAHASGAGAWGPRASGGEPTAIGNSQVAVVDNLVVNPPGVASQYSQLAVYGPRAAADSGSPDPAVADDGLVIRGNTLWNGAADLDLGLGGEQGCAESHPTCSPEAVRALNAINTGEPAVTLAAGVVPVPAGVIDAGSGAGLAVPTFDWSRLPGHPVPAVAMPTQVGADRAGVSWAGRSNPGAYAGAAPTTVVVLTGTSRSAVTTRTGQQLGGSGGPFVVLRGSWLELTARPPAGRPLAGWTGACAGQRGATCVVAAVGPTLTVGVSVH